MDLTSQKIGFIGGGNMARAIGAGLIKKGVLDPKKIWVSARTEKTLEFWKNLGTMTSLRNTDVVANCNVIFIAVKPQMFDHITADIASGLAQRRDAEIFFLSVMVGVTLETLRKKIVSHLTDVYKGPDRFGIVRTMPNTPLMVGSGITVYCCDDNITSEECSLVHEIFSHLGLTENVPESQMNAISALSGSGPAFAYEIIEALSDGAVMAGVPRAMATKFAAQVLVGAGNMVLETKKHPGELKDEVCSPGGTTIHGVHAMEEGGVRVSMMNAIKSAVARAEQLAIQTQK